MQWPDGFMWGTGASSTQCEGASSASDWWDWERAGRAPLSHDGNGFATRYADDFALMAGLGLTHHRLSIEWARIEPEPGVHDQAAIEHHRAAEYGIGTADDAERVAYLTRGLEVVQERLAAGVDVAGFFHWTAVDNYEWLHGFDPDAAFGIIDADRALKPSAEVLAREARR